MLWLARHIAPQDRHMETFRAVARDIGRLLTFRYDSDDKLTKTEVIAVRVVSVASFIVIFSLWRWG